MNMMLGLIPPTSGTVNVLGYDVSQNPIEVRQRIGYVPESLLCFIHQGSVRCACRSPGENPDNT
jgi:ABC-type multidrug transport system ATPase subunit